MPSGTLAFRMCRICSTEVTSIVFHLTWWPYFPILSPRPRRDIYSLQLPWYWLISQPEDLSDIDIRISMSIFDSQMTEKCSTEISLHMAKLRYDTKKELLFPICEKKYFCCFCRKFQTNKIIHGSKNSCPGIMT